MNHYINILLLVVILCLLFPSLQCVDYKPKDKKDEKSRDTKKASASSSSTHVQIKHDPNDHKGLSAFFLQNPRDGTCLGPKGFTMCDENALWLLTTRANRDTYSLVSFLSPSSNICLQRKSSFFGFFHSDQVILGSCNTKSAKSWKWEWINQKERVLRLSNLGKCISQGGLGKNRNIHSDFSMKSCENANDGTVIDFEYHLTAVHEDGFLITTASGDCFDGENFRSCSSAGSSAASKLSSLYWGIGIRYVWGEARRYLFKFPLPERNKCLAAKGKNTIGLGDCDTSGGVLTWGLQQGQLSYNHGKKCVSRTLTENQPILTDCKETHEYMIMNIPATNYDDHFLTLLKSPVSDSVFFSFPIYSCCLVRTCRMKRKQF
jgi:hypothetical protein